MLEWIKSHPYLAGGLTLGLLFLFIALKNSSSSSAPSVTSGGPSDALQAAALSANVAATQADTAARVQTHVVDVAGAIQSQQSSDQLSAINTQAQAQTDQAMILTNAQTAQAQIAAGVAATKIQADVNTAQITGGFSFATAQAEAAAAETEALSANATALGISQVQAGRDVNLATIGAGVTDLQTTDALAAQKDIDNASIINNRTNGTTQIALGTLSANVQNNSIAAQLAALLDTNKTNLGINSSNNATVQQVTQINANRDVNIANITTAATTTQTQIAADANTAQENTLAQLYQHLIDVNGNIATDQINANYNLQSNILTDFHTTDFNRGGQGGANQVAAWSALLGAPSVGTAAEQAGGGGFNWGSFLTGLGNLFAGVGKGATGVGIGAGTASLGH